MKLSQVVMLRAGICFSPGGFSSGKRDVFPPGGFPPENAYTHSIFYDFFIWNGNIFASLMILIYDGFSVMLVKDNDFNVFWMLLIICLSSAVVALGIRDTNRHYRPVAQRVTRAEMQRLVLAMHGYIDIEEAARRRRVRAEKASNARQSEYDSVLRFVKTLIP